MGNERRAKCALLVLLTVTLNRSLVASFDNFVGASREGFSGDGATQTDGGESARLDSGLADGTASPISDAATVAVEGGLRYGQTWLWNGARWREAEGAQPSPRSDVPTAIWDPERREHLLFGGLGPGAALGDTWTWNAAGWSQRVVTPAPSPRFNYAVAWDPIRKRVVLFGGLAAPDTNHTVTSVAMVRR